MSNKGIYKIINLINGKIYIGKTFDSFSNRFCAHRHKLKYNKHENRYLQNSFNKYGKDNFSFEVIEVIDNLDFLAKREKYWIEYYNTYNRQYGYNITIINNDLSYIHPIETRIRISKSNKGKKHTEEAKLKMSLAHKGIKPSVETRKKWSEQRKGRKGYWTGKTMSEKHKNKLSEKRKGEDNANAKLNEKQVRAIRAFKELENRPTNKELAEFFGVYVSTIEKILSRTTWSHI